MTLPHDVRVLLVEDHALVRQAMQEQLADFGFEVVAVAVDGPSFLELYAEHRPDIVLSDVKLPGFSGIEATRRLLADHPEARVLLISAAVDERAVNAGIAAGAVGYVLKSIDATELYVFLMEAAEGWRGIFDRTTALCVPGGS